MSFPTIPDINPKINLDRDDSINLLLASIAFEELGLAHIINAEGEKIQHALGTLHHGKQKYHHYADIDDLLDINKSVRQTLNTIVKKEMLLQMKLENIIDLIRASDDHEE